MARADQRERERLRLRLVALNMRAGNGPLQAAAFLHRKASKARESDRYLFARATGGAPVVPEWPPSALAAALAPLTGEEIEKARTEIRRAAERGVSIVTWLERDFPVNLRRSLSPPPVLYARGQLLVGDRAAVAVVGTRRASREYREFAADLAYELAKEGFTVVSGLARGIDRAAHEGALEAGGRTLAVLGTGVDVVYPPEHGPLAEAVSRHGALLSFYPLGTPPLPFRFPARNWVIAGLCLGVVVVQAAAVSGALITANAAACMGREVMAVPGPTADPRYQGSNGLIRDGAVPVMSARDVLKRLEALLETERLGHPAPGERSPHPLPGDAPARPEGEAAAGESPEQLPLDGWAPLEAVLAALVDGPATVEELAEQCGTGIGETQAALTRLEIEGKAVAIGGGRWRLSPRRRPSCR